MGGGTEKEIILGLDSRAPGLVVSRGGCSPYLQHLIRAHEHKIHVIFQSILGVAVGSVVPSQGGALTLCIVT